MNAIENIRRELQMALPEYQVEVSQMPDGRHCYVTLTHVVVSPIHPTSRICMNPVDNILGQLLSSVEGAKVSLEDTMVERKDL